MQRFLHIVLTCILLFYVQTIIAKEKAPECEVCVEMLTSATKDLSSKAKKDLSKIEEHLEDYCDESKNQLSSTYKKLCYYIKPIKREVSQPLQNGVPIDRICKRLKKKSAEICAIRPPVPVEKGKTDYNKMRVKQLKKILSDRGVVCKNCLEKSEFVKMCQDSEHLEL